VDLKFASLLSHMSKRKFYEFPILILSVLFSVLKYKEKFVSSPGNSDDNLESLCDEVHGYMYKYTVILNYCRSFRRT
jgi:hypothetical protein